MATTLTYGRQVPDAGDRGVPLFVVLENNIKKDDAHNHDGVNSPALTAQSIVGIVDTLAHANWVAATATGHYKQLVTMHAGFLFDTTKISFRTTDGKYIYPTVERVTSSTYYVYTIDNTLDYLAVYGG